MLFKVVAVKDRCLDSYGSPIFVVTTGQAVRSFTDEVNRVDVNNQMNKHPKDFELYEVGTFDNDTGRIENAAELRILARGEDVFVSGA